jgi:hypothetical protein
MTAKGRRSRVSNMQCFSQPREFRDDHSIDEGKTKLCRIADTRVGENDFAIEAKTLNKTQM